MNAEVLQSKFKSLQLNEKLNKLKKINCFVSKFAGGSIYLKGFSKFSDIKSEMDLTIPMEVDLKILPEGENRDGYISPEDLEESVVGWSRPAIIDFHDMLDMKNPTKHKISDRKGFLGKNPRIEMVDGREWIFNNAFITDRYLAYLIYLADKNGRPLQISPEYGWRPYWVGGRKHQGNINPHLITIVDKGHIEGNKLTIKNA